MPRANDPWPPLVKASLDKISKEGNANEQNDIGARHRPDLLLLNTDCRNAEFVMVK
jgi:hypothetical protein